MASNDDESFDMKRRSRGKRISTFKIGLFDSTLPYIDDYQLLDTQSNILPINYSKQSNNDNINNTIYNIDISLRYSGEVDLCGTSWIYTPPIAHSLEKLKSDCKRVSRFKNLSINDSKEYNLLTEINSGNKLDNSDIQKNILSIPKRKLDLQINFTQKLIPDLWLITNSSYYWGAIDRSEADKMLEDKPHGTFLLRDSTQEGFLFSISFRRYNRNINVRIEQKNGWFSFYINDPTFYRCETISGLIEKYITNGNKSHLRFEPLLISGLKRNFVWPLIHLCRAKICSIIRYHQIEFLPLPTKLKNYLKHYHYEEKICK